jgi:CHASE2 domain-containing sensor protein
MVVLAWTTARRIAPSRIERLSGWCALAWAWFFFNENPTDTFWSLRPLQAIETLWACAFIVLAALQLGGSLARHRTTRLLGAVAAIATWLFLAAQIAIAWGGWGPFWITSLILAWGCSCSLGDLLKGDRRA